MLWQVGLGQLNYHRISTNATTTRHRYNRITETQHIQNHIQKPIINVLFIFENKNHHKEWVEDGKIIYTRNFLIDF